jgi:DNA-binding winged helix-turn-helix (wHTH) protein/tetratricopeptide (TPR) repeat protein
LATSRRYRFGRFCMDLEERVLLREDKPVALTPKLFETLRILVESHGHIVEKDQLMKQVWPDAFVEEGNLTANIFQLRRSLGVRPDHGEYIETIPKRGYRFVAPVESAAAPEISESSPAVSVITSLAVLPLENSLGDPEIDYLADGVTESLIRVLSEISDCRVMSRHSVYHYKGRNPDAVEVGRKLDVDAVLTGRLSTLRDRLIVSIELVDAKDNHHIWGTRCDRRTVDSFTLPEEIALEVAGRLRPRIKAQRLIPKRATSSNEAYHLYLKGRYHWNKRTTEAIENAIRYFQHALAADSDYALAYAGLADCYTLLASASYGQRTSQDSMRDAKVAAAKAMELDSALAEAHTSMAFVTFRLDWNWEIAEKEFRRANILNPNYPTSHHWYAIYLAALDRSQEAIQEITLALELDPLSLIINSAAGRVYHFARQYNRAIEQFMKTLELDPGFMEAHYDLGMTYAQLDRLDEAVVQIEEALAQSPGRTIAKAVQAHILARAGQVERARQRLSEIRELVMRGQASSSALALVHTGLGEKQEAIRYLEQAYLERDGLLVYLKVEPMYDTLRAEPRFSALAKKLRLPV